MPPQGKGRRGFHKKYRKIDTTTVDDHLDDLRNQTITFGKPLAKIASEDIFIEDLEGDAVPELEEEVPSIPSAAYKKAVRDNDEDDDADEDHSEQVAGQRMTRAEAKRLHCQQKELKTVQVLDPWTRSKHPPLHNFKKNPTEYRITDRPRTKSLYNRSEETVDPVKQIQVDDDVWLTSQQVAEEELQKERERTLGVLTDEQLAEYNALIRYGCRKENISRKPGFKPSVYRPVQPEDLVSGMSYRPEESERQKVAQIAARQELKALEEQRYLQANKVRFPKRTHGMFVDMISTIDAAADFSDPDNEDEGRSRRLLRPRPTKITAKQRRKEKRTRMESFQRHLDSRNSRVLKQMKQLAEIETNMVSKVKQNRMKRLRRRQTKILEVFQTKKLSKLPFKKPEQAVLLAEEVPDRLLQLAPQANGFTEVQTSMQRRNIIEVRKRARRPRQKGRVTYEAATSKFNVDLQWEYKPPPEFAPKTKKR